MAHKLSTERYYTLFYTACQHDMKLESHKMSVRASSCHKSFSAKSIFHHPHIHSVYKPMAPVPYLPTNLPESHSLIAASSDVAMGETPAPSRERSSPAADFCLSGTWYEVLHCKSLSLPTTALPQQRSTKTRSRLGAWVLPTRVLHHGDVEEEYAFRVLEPADGVHRVRIGVGRQ